MNELAVFAGHGGGLLAHKLLSRVRRVVCAVEWNAYAASVLAARQNDGFLEAFPIWDDVRTFDGIPWRSLVDCVSGGFPCKGVSTTGPGTGLAHPESATYIHQIRIVREVEPYRVELENSPALTRRGLGIILGELAALGFDAEWDVLSAAEEGACHERERIWVVATHPDRPQCKGGELSCGKNAEHPELGLSSWWKDKPGIRGVDDGVAHRMDRLVGIGNGQVPIVAARAWETLKP